jgi:hypothetical protein
MGDHLTQRGSAPSANARVDLSGRTNSTGSDLSILGSVCLAALMKDQSLGQGDCDNGDDAAIDRLLRFARDGRARAGVAV